MTNNVVIDQRRNKYDLGFISNGSNLNIDPSLSSLKNVDKDNFPCGYCQKTSKTFLEMVKHVENNHNELMPDETTYNSANSYLSVGPFRPGNKNSALKIFVRFSN